MKNTTFACLAGIGLASAAQAGMGHHTSGERSIHAIYLEVGCTEDEANYSNVPTPGTTVGITTDYSIDLDIIPITLNYRHQSVIMDNLNWDAGLGLGSAILDNSCDWSWFQVVAPPKPSSGKGDGDEIDVVFFGDVFAGLSYDLSQCFCIVAGVRYIFMESMNLEIEQ